MKNQAASGWNGLLFGDILREANNSHSEQKIKGDSQMERIIFFTGKGGVGKSSVAAAHARKSALQGKKTLLISTDMAHNLGDIFEKKIGRNEVEVAPNLYAIELDPEYILENDFADLQVAIKNMFASKGLGNLQNSKQMMMPGMEELFSLLKILDFYEKGEYDRIIVDCAPTGETLSLLKFPELLSWYMEKFFPLGKVAMRVLAPVSKQLWKIELPDKHAMTDIEKLYLRLNELQELLKDNRITSIRIVTLPEKMVVEETKRNYMYMNLFGYLVDGVYINRVLPADVDNAFFTEWMDIQKKYIEELEDNFADVPVIRIPWYESEVCGMDAIDRICSGILTGDELFDVNSKRTNEKFEKNDDGYLLSIFLPFVSKEKLDMHQADADIIIRIGNFKRNIPIPTTLRNYQITSAKLKDAELKIQFSEKEG